MSRSRRSFGLVSNANYLMFDSTNVLEQFLFQAPIHREIGTDLSLGFENRPFLNDNLILTCGVSSLIPARGFKDIFNPMVGKRRHVVRDIPASCRDVLADIDGALRWILGR